MPYKDQTDQNKCQKRYYERNKEYYKRKAKEKKQEIRKWYSDYKKTLSCEICGEDYYACIDLHHKENEEKTDRISLMIGQGYSKKRMLEEIEKCIPLCANCHRKVHGGILKVAAGG
jgi:hypothetical protein